MKVHVYVKQDGRVLVLNKPKGITLVVSKETDTVLIAQIARYHHMTDIKEQNSEMWHLLKR